MLFLLKKIIIIKKTAFFFLVLKNLELKGLEININITAVNNVKLSHTPD